MPYGIHTVDLGGYVYQEAATWVNYKTLISADCFY